MAKRKVDDPSGLAASTFNMTPMIDVTFQLIVVFLCSMKFRTLDQKIEAFLPYMGQDTVPHPEDVRTKLPLRLRRGPADPATTVLLVGSRIGTTAAEGVWPALAARIREFRDRDPGIKGAIDADPDVVHEDVIRALDCFLAAGLVDVEFRGTRPPR